MTRTLSARWDRYSTVALARQTPYTRQSYRVVWKHRIQPHLGSLLVSDLTVPIVEDWLADLHASGLSWNTCRNARVVLSAILANSESGTGTFGMVATVFVSITAPSVNALGPR